MVEFKPRYESLIDIVESSVRLHRDRPLFGTKRRGVYSYVSYLEFSNDVDALRSALEGLGINAGDRVAILAGNRIEWAVAAYAAYGRRAAFVAMNEHQPERDWAHIVADSGASLLFVPGQVLARRVEAMRASFPSLRHIVVLEGPTELGTLPYGGLIEKGRAQPSPALRPSGNDAAAIVYTSGTTGTPKGVVLSHQNFAHNVSAVREFFPVDPSDRSLAFLSWAHAFGQTVELHGLLSSGASMALSRGMDKVPRELEEVRPTLLITVPLVWNRLYDRFHRELRSLPPLEKKVVETALRSARQRRDLASKRRTSGVADLKARVFDELVWSKVRAKLGGRVRFAFSGAAGLSREVAEFVDDAGISLYEGYGMTETSPIVAANHPGARKLGTVGRPIPGVRVEIDNEAIDDPKNGEIVVFGHNVMLGYHGLEAENDRVFVERGSERGVRSGDMGFIDGEGYLHITGRIKEQYKLASGRYVVPTPLESALTTSSFIRAAMVFGEGEATNSVLIIPEMSTLLPWARELGLLGDAPSLIDSLEVRSLLEAEVARISATFRSYERIALVIPCLGDFTVDNGLLTSTLKIRRARVLDAYAETIERARARR